MGTVSYMAASIELNGIWYTIGAEHRGTHILWQVEDNGLVRSFEKLLPNKYVANTIAQMVREITPMGHATGRDFLIYMKRCEKKDATLGKVLNANIMKPFYMWIESISDPMIYAVQRKALAYLGKNADHVFYKDETIYKTYWAKDALRMRAAHLFVSAGMYRRYMYDGNNYIGEYKCDLNKWQEEVLGPNSSKAVRRTMSNLSIQSTEFLRVLSDLPITKPVDWWVKGELMIGRFHRAENVRWINEIENASNEDIKAALNMFAANAGFMINDWRNRKAIRIAIGELVDHSAIALDFIDDLGFVGACQEAANRARPEYWDDEGYMGGHGITAVDLGDFQPLPIDLPKSYKCTQIMNHKDLIAASKDMHNCSSGYANSCKNGQYYIVMAYNVDDPKDRCMLGINADLSVSQCYGPCNQRTPFSIEFEKSYKKLYEIHMAKKNGQTLTERIKEVLAREFNGNEIRGWVNR